MLGYIKPPVSVIYRVEDNVDLQAEQDQVNFYAGR